MSADSSTPSTTGKAARFVVPLSCLCLLGCGPDEQAVEPHAKPIPSEAQLKTPDPPTVQALAEEQVRFDQTVFRHEVDAQAYESAFVALWDRLRSTEPFTVLRQFPFILSLIHI